MTSTPFSREVYPPAPILEIRLSSLDESPRTSTLSALIDTGSDFTLVPLRYIQMIDPTESRQARVRGLFGESQFVTLYYVDLHLTIGKLIAVEVAAIEESGEFDDVDVILGRNVLNRLHIFMDGPAFATFLLERKPIQF